MCLTLRIRLCGMSVEQCMESLQISAVYVDSCLFIWTSDVAYFSLSAGVLPIALISALPLVVVIAALLILIVITYRYMQMHIRNNQMTTLT